MLRVGLTGGIGAGKSEVARRLAGHGAVVIDADRVAREVVAPGTDGLARVVAEFGPQVLAPDGSLDRAALASVVFGDDERRRRLEAIVHPRVRARTAELVAAAPPDAIVVNDVPLLVEAGLAATYHLVVVVEATEATRIARLVGSRGMTEEQARARIAAQASDEVRRAAADVLLTNDGPLADLYARVDRLWRDRLVPFEENVRLRRSARPPEGVRIVPYDPAWPAQYQRLAARLRHAAGGVAQRIDHIGSTAVPDLAARDIIDIQLVVPDLAAADALAEPLAEAGFPPVEGEWHDSPRSPYPDPAAWRKRLHGGADPDRIVNLHVRPAHGPAWRVALLLRDFWRADPAARDEYAALKRRLRDEGLTATGYAERKEPWFDAVWPRARRWAEQTGWAP
ncbi:MAG TPA: dephospho-CoA kinase [Natronosporangium sp.]|nr:dephospho-CoA kinase [Natronosporangium sp.]